MYGWRPYVPVAKRKAAAAKHLKKNKSYQPVLIEGRTIAHTFWGKSWCDNLERYSDYENRLPRGRTYARSGSILDLQITQGAIHAKVMGTYLYEADITIAAMPSAKWKTLAEMCSGKIDSLIELLQGRFSHHVMETMIHPDHGLFPDLDQIEMTCSCPDGSHMCKHIAATLYGVGARLDHHPELLFTLRHVDHLDLLAHTTPTTLTSHPDSLEEASLASLFNIDLTPSNPEPEPQLPPKQPEDPIELSPQQVALLMQIPLHRLYSLLKTNAIPSRRIGKHWLISFTDVIHYRKSKKI